MIKLDIVIRNNKVYRKTYSTDGYMIIQDETGYKYNVAYDPLHIERTYQESDERIPSFEGSDEPVN